MSYSCHCIVSGVIDSCMTCSKGVIVTGEREQIDQSIRAGE